MDQRVIQSLKCQYRKRVIYTLLRAIETGNDIKINVYQALEMLQQAWGNVTSTIILNCFKHAGFQVSDFPPQESEDDPDDDIPLAMLPTTGLSQTLVKDFTSVDDQLQTSTDVSDKSIIANVLSRRQIRLPKTKTTTMKKKK